MDIAIILETRYSGSEWTLNGSDYEGLTWLSDTPKPTEKQLADLWALVQTELQAKAQDKIDAKASAISKLQALGLTVDEVEAAFGLTE
jgi:hypothetical protein